MAVQEISPLLPNRGSQHPLRSSPSLGPSPLRWTEQLALEVFNKQTQQGLLELPLARQSLESNLLLMCWGRLGAGSVMARLRHLPPA